MDPKHHDQTKAEEAVKLANIQSIVRPVPVDETRPATTYHQELTLFADETPVVMRTEGTEQNGVTFGVWDTGTRPYQAVRWNDGGADLVGPPFLHRADAAQEHAEDGAEHNQQEAHAPVIRQDIAETIRNGRPTGDRHRTSVRDRLAAVALPLRVEEFHYDAHDRQLHSDAEMEHAQATSYVIYDGGEDRVAEASITYGPGDSDRPASDLAELQAAVALILHAPADLHALLAATDRTQRDELAQLLRWAAEITQGSNDAQLALALVHRLANWASTAAQ
ncbi:hypothetical protein [Streptomyces nanshensis]|uniref:Uncharacterized protein n=1 Tax=Streptomyces nanshensis TaxID=518642 RepID=A0A1E7L8I2_9ACTN|nr:hypothetical protein [Streptomyces nanshensis]OEV12468.1 hypothetical protein AN218_08110 [Streptomyces nanshensis]